MELCSDWCAGHQPKLSQLNGWHHLALKPPTTFDSLSNTLVLLYFFHHAVSAVMMINKCLFQHSNTGKAMLSFRRDDEHLERFSGQGRRKIYKAISSNVQQHALTITNTHITKFSWN